MAVDPTTEAENEMTEQAKWGLSISDRAIVRLVAGVKQLAARLRQLEERVKALEAK